MIKRTAIENKHHTAGHSLGLDESSRARRGPRSTWYMLIFQEPYNIGKPNAEILYAKENSKPKFFCGNIHARCQLPLTEQSWGPHKVDPTLQASAQAKGYTLISIKIADAKHAV